MSITVQKSIEELLASEGVITYKVRGKSMEPMINSIHDLVTIRKIDVSDKFTVNDVVLYRQKGSLTLHRIVDVSQDGTYVLLGDNCSRFEYGILRQDIIGILIRFKHNGKIFDTHDPKYIKYINELNSVRSVRMARKLFYDIIIQHTRFLHPSFHNRMKAIMKKLIILKLDF